MKKYDPVGAFSLQLPMTFTPAGSNEEVLLHTVQECLNGYISFVESLPEKMSVNLHFPFGIL